jgi:hypothetical protein
MIADNLSSRQQGSQRQLAFSRHRTGDTISERLKHALGAKVPARTKSKLKAAAEEHMTMSRPRLLQRPKRQVCRLETSKGRINKDCELLCIIGTFKLKQVGR